MTARNRVKIVPQTSTATMETQNAYPVHLNISANPVAPNAPSAPPTLTGIPTTDVSRALTEQWVVGEKATDPAHLARNTPTEVVV